MYLHRQERRFQQPDYNFELVNLIKENDSASLEQKIDEKGINATESNFVLDVNERKNQRDEPVDNFKEDRITLLHIAAYFDSLECFVFLHEEKGLPLSAHSAKSYYPLHYACFSGSREVVSYILSKSPSMAAELPDDIPHHFLYFAVYGGDPVILEELFKNGADLNKNQNKNDDPIGKSIDISNIECLKVLLEHDVHSQNTKNQTPAMLASLNCHPKALEILVKSSEDLGYFTKNSATGKYESVVSLMFSYSSGSIFKDVLINLLTKHPDVRIEPPDDVVMDGVCHWICRMCDVQVAELMIRTKDVNINRLDSNGHTGPYYLSMQKDFKDGDAQTSIKILEILIQNNFKVNFRKDERSPTILEIFVKAMKTRYKIIEFLLNNDADPHASYSKNPRISLYDEVMSDRIRDRQLKEIFAPYAKD